MISVGPDPAARRDDRPAGPPESPFARRPGLPRRLLRPFLWGPAWLFGAASLVSGLAVLAALPVLQFLSLGYLLEAGGRVARTGRLRDGFLGVWRAALVGAAAASAWLLLLPLRLVASLTASARLIDPDSGVTRGWETGLAVVTVLTVLAEVLAAQCLLAIWRGGRLGYFVQPFTHPIRWYVEVRDTVWDFVLSLRLPYYFWLGVRGFAGGLAWLALPVTLLALGTKVPAAGLLGGLLLAVVLLYVPFLQMRFAAENRFRALFAWRAVRADFRRAPVAFAVALVVALLFAVPLYLLKIELVPREVTWLPGLVFIVFIFPARLLAGWAVGRARRREAPRHWLFRWAARPVMLAAAAVYVGVVFFTQFTSWHGVASLYEQHAFLLPVPFLGG